MKNIITSTHLPRQENTPTIKEGDIFYIPHGVDDYVIYSRVSACDFKFISLQKGSWHDIKAETFFENYPNSQKLKKGNSILITAN